MATQVGKPTRERALRHTYSQRAVAGVHAWGERRLRFKNEGEWTWPETSGQSASERRQSPQAGLHLPKVDRDQRHSGRARPSLHPTQPSYSDILSRVDRKPIKSIGGIGHDSPAAQYLDGRTECRAGRVVADKLPSCDP